MDKRFLHDWICAPRDRNQGEMGIKMDVDNPVRYKGIDSLVLMDSAGTSKAHLSKHICVKDN